MIFGEIFKEWTFSLKVIFCCLIIPKYQKYTLNNLNFGIVFCKYFRKHNTIGCVPSTILREYSLLHKNSHHVVVLLIITQSKWSGPLIQDLWLRSTKNVDFP